jgi:DNA polymerase III alpha subunit
MLTSSMSRLRTQSRDIQYINDKVKEITEETAGFLIFQEQIALLAHKLGDNISLDEGNKLRKLLTKKGTGKGNEEKEQIRQRFIKGCLAKSIAGSPPPRTSGEILSISLGMALISLMLLLIAYFLTNAPGS